MANEVTKAVTNQIAKRDPNAPMIQPMRKADVQQLLEDNAEELKKALPRHLTIERMLKVLVFCIDQNPDLLKCTQKSLFACVKQLAELGLEPGGVRGLAYLIPFKVGGADLNRTCTLIVGYKGFVHLARQGGFLQDIEARVVHQNDRFEFEFGLQPRLRHVPALDSPGRPTAVYCVAKMKHNSNHVEVMSWAEVMAIKARSRSKDDGPWKTDEEQMARKTVIRRAANYLPLSTELALAASLEDADTIDGEVVRIREVAAPPAPRPDKPQALPEDSNPITGEVQAQPEKVPVVINAKPSPSGGVKTVMEAPVDVEAQARKLEQEKAEAGIAAEQARAAAPESIRMLRDKQAHDYTRNSNEVGSHYAGENEAHVVVDGIRIPTGTPIHAQWLKENPPASAQSANPVDRWLADVRSAETMKGLKTIAALKPEIPPERQAECDMAYRAAKVSVKG